MSESLYASLKSWEKLPTSAREDVKLIFRHLQPTLPLGFSVNVQSSSDSLYFTLCSKNRVIIKGKSTKTKIDWIPPYMNLYHVSI